MLYVFKEKRVFAIIDRLKWAAPPIRLRLPARCNDRQNGLPVSRRSLMSAKDYSKLYSSKRISHNTWLISGIRWYIVCVVKKIIPCFHIDEFEAHICVVLNISICNHHLSVFHQTYFSWWSIMQSGHIIYKRLSSSHVTKIVISEGFVFSWPGKNV